MTDQKVYEKYMKENLNWIMKKADAEFSKWIKKRDKYICITCSKQCVEGSQGTQAGHFVQRFHLSTRYDEHNVHCQCYSCNFCKSGNYTVYRDKLLEKYGEEEVKRIEKKAKDTFYKLTKENLIEIYLKYKHLNEVKDGNKL
jgi:hypothetical protein